MTVAVLSCASLSMSRLCSSAASLTARYLTERGRLKHIDGGRGLDVLLVTGGRQQNARKAWATTPSGSHTRRAGAMRVRVVRRAEKRDKKRSFPFLAGRGNELRTPLLVRKPVWVDSLFGSYGGRSELILCSI